MIGYPEEGSLMQAEMGCRDRSDNLGPYWGRGDSEGGRDNSGAPGRGEGPRKSARPRHQSHLQQWEGAT